VCSPKPISALISNPGVRDSFRPGSHGIKGWKMFQPAGTLRPEKSFGPPHNAADELIHEA